MTDIICFYVVYSRIVTLAYQHACRTRTITSLVE